MFWAKVFPVKSIYAKITLYNDMSETFWEAADSFEDCEVNHVGSCISVT